VENFVFELKKRDEIIVKLTNKLKLACKQKGDGDHILHSVEKNVSVLIN
jgi:hypothetical protein